MLTVQTHRKPPAYIALIRRLHFYIGLLVGPLPAGAAISGLAYALTPQLEDWLYVDVLHSNSHGPANPLNEQINSDLQTVGHHDVVAPTSCPCPATYFVCG